MRRDVGEFQDLRPYAPGQGPESRPRGDRGRARIEEEDLELRPRTVGELLDLAFGLLRSRFGTYVGLCALMWFPVRAAQPFIGAGKLMGVGGNDFSWGVLLGLSFTLLATAVVTFFEISVLSILVASSYSGRRIAVSGALRHAASRFLSVLLIAIVGGILESMGWICFCLPGLLLAWLLYLAPAVCVIEDANVPESFARSVELSWPRILPWMGLAGVSALAALPFGSLAGIVDNREARAWLVEAVPLSASAFDWTMVGFSSLFLGVATAIRGVVVTVWYFDCRAIREGADLEARLARAAADAPSRAGSPA